MYVNRQNQKARLPFDKLIVIMKFLIDGIHKMLIILVKVYKKRFS